MAQHLYFILLILKEANRISPLRFVLIVSYCLYENVKGKLLMLVSAKILRRDHASHYLQLSMSPSQERVAERKRLASLALHSNGIISVSMVSSLLA